LKLFDKAKREGLNLAISAYASYTPLARRVWALSYSFILACEGTAWIFGHTILPHGRPNYSALMQSTIDYGPLNIFTAALLATDSSAIHLRSPLFQIAWGVKLLYPLFSAALSIVLLVSESAFGSHRNWVAIRLLVTVLWICAYLGELKWWEHQIVPVIPGAELEEFSESDGESESVASDDSRDIFDRQPFVPHDQRL
jgi:hypothetical protein